MSDFGRALPIVPRSAPQGNGRFLEVRRWQSGEPETARKPAVKISAILPYASGFFWDAVRIPHGLANISRPSHRSGLRPYERVSVERQRLMSSEPEMASIAAPVSHHREQPHVRGVARRSVSAGRSRLFAALLESLHRHAILVGDKLAGQQRLVFHRRAFPSDNRDQAEPLHALLRIRQ